MSGNNTSRSWESRMGLFLIGILVALVIYSSAAACVTGATGEVRREGGNSGPLSTGQVMLGGVLFLWPASAQLFLGY